jgi:NTE family protein
MNSDARFDPNQLKALSLFAGLEESVLQSISERLELSWLPAGTDLFEQGDAADALYVLLSGALVAITPDPDGGAPRWVGDIRAGETVGEMAMLSGKARGATVRAVRDSEVLRFKRSDFEALVSTNAAAMLHIARVAFARLELSAQNQGSMRRSSKTLAVLPGVDGFDVLPFAHELLEALQRFGSCLMIDQALAKGKSSSWFHQLEQQHAHLVYVANSNHGSWFELCCRQSDELLYIVQPATQSPPVQPLRPDDSLKRERVVLLHGHTILRGAAATWRKALDCTMHHHVLQGTDIERLAREITGFATGIVLSGGGARGFAHLGVIRALREHGLQIDRVAGTSIGAIMGSGLAMQFSDEELYHRYHRSFVAHNPLRDYTFPFIALVAGRKASAQLRLESEERDITDLWLPYFCVSTNLTRGILHEHHEGPLWRALRASIAIPGILSPVFHEGQVFVDGGVMNNLPVELLRRGFSGKVIAVDIAGDYAIRAGVEEADLPSMWRMMRDWFAGIRPRPNILQILLRAGMVNSASTMANNRAQCDLMIRPPVDTLELLDWHSFDRAIQIGYAHTVALIEQGKLS